MGRSYTINTQKASIAPRQALHNNPDLSETNINGERRNVQERSTLGRIHRNPQTHEETLECKQHKPKDLTSAGYLKPNSAKWFKPAKLSRQKTYSHKDLKSRKQR